MVTVQRRLTPYNLAREWLKWGWDDWHVTDNGYGEFNYDLHENGATNYYGAGDANYMTYVLSSKAQDFINAHAREPFFSKSRPSRLIGHIPPPMQTNTNSLV